jgi:hypothetical protein
LGSRTLEVTLSSSQHPLGTSQGDSSLPRRCRDTPEAAHNTPQVHDIGSRWFLSLDEIYPNQLGVWIPPFAQLLEVGGNCIAEPNLRRDPRLVGELRHVPPHPSGNRSVEEKHD